MRCTVLGSMPNRAAILRTLSPVSLRAFRAARMRASMARSAKLFAFTDGPAQPGAHPFLNDRTLELGKDAEHLKHCLAARRRSVETLLVQE